MCVGNVIEVHELTKKFGTCTALDNFSLCVPEGKIFGLIGPNGAGKSTLMRVLLDIVRITSGKAEVLGKSAQHAKASLRKDIGYLPGEIHLMPRMSCWWQLKYWAGIGGGKQALEYATELAELFELDLRRKAGVISKGNKQKLGIIQAFMHRPRLLIIDEPSSGLDPVGQQLILSIIENAHKEGASVFLSSHVLSEIEHVASEAAVLRLGKLVKQGTMEDLRASAQRRIKIRLGYPTGLPRIEFIHQLEQQTKLLGGGIMLSADNDWLLLNGVISGNFEQLISLLKRYEILDLVCAEPTLEESVLSIYNEER